MKKDVKAEVTKEVKKVVAQLKTAQKQLEGFFKNTDIVGEARKYADKQKKELQKLIHGDVTLVKEFLERQKGELDKIQKRIPTEVNKIKKYVASQRGDIEKLIGKVKKAAAGARTGAKRKTTRKSAPRKKSDLSQTADVASAPSNDNVTPTT